MTLPSEPLRHYCGSPFGTLFPMVATMYIPQNLRTLGGIAYNCSQIYY